ncbi:hypothetical protein EPA93_42680 [Ktedonosporobacter rubrisoli]|uniref:Zinc-finger domain-containing protein n=1 Tax=Ktedonosporobacter rubrisoli TaxID=2509675 RepID=A0A4P6K3I7_KTERU|nr:hypothetical protein [Ktedonosporobacter rubrisoli]QBD82330.1 hypothetical protein EPA93_42680 [Ktedonosporobacter rubrisoli]
MQCSEPGAIREEEIVAYLAGEKVRPAVVQHLARCQYCSARLATYRQMERELTSKLYRLDCPSNQVLGEYQLGFLDPKEVLRVQKHLEICKFCSAEVATLAQFLANDLVLAERPSVARSKPSLNHHIQQEAGRVVEQLSSHILSEVRRIVATLVPSQPASLALRGEEALWPRNYVAEDVSVSIQVEQGTHRNDSVQLIGFVSRKDTDLGALQGIAVQLVSPAKHEYVQYIDELGNFIFSSIMPATYTLEMQFPESVIVIEQLAVVLDQ